MLVLIKEIPVTFEPHWADERMLWLTAGSIAVSALLGFFAYWNGRRAIKISKDSAVRERKRLRRERKRLEAEGRSELAVAASRAINAIHYNISRNPNSPEEHLQKVRDLQNDLILEAGSRIDVAVLVQGREGLSLWFRRTTNRLRDLGYAYGERDSRYEKYRAAVQSNLARWNAGLMTSEELLETFNDAPAKPDPHRGPPRSPEHSDAQENG